MLEKLKNISGLLFRKKTSKEKITEEQVRIFFEGMAELLENGDAGKGVVEYAEITAAMNEMWNYREVETLIPEEAFLYGGVWGAIQLEHTVRRYKAERYSMNQLIQAFRKDKKGNRSVDLLEVIERNPGITHKALAEKLYLSPSDLSQTISRLEQEKLFMAQRLGREKYYFLQERGKELLRRLRPKISAAQMLESEMVIDLSNQYNFSQRMKKFEQLPFVQVESTEIREYVLYNFYSAGNKGVLGNLIPKLAYMPLIVPRKEPKEFDEYVTDLVIAQDYARWEKAVDRAEARKYAEYV